MKRSHRAACWLVLTAALTTSSSAAAPDDALRLQRPLVLLGEVHDNAQQAALRLAAVEALLASGARPALLMEQLDADRQADIDRLRSDTTPTTADALIDAVGGRGWQWALYRPVLALALQHGLPIVAVNVSRQQAAAIMRDGLAAHGYQTDAPAAVLDTLASLIQASHCGMVSPAQARTMALAQVARDQAMARAVQVHAARGVLLLAGNGHVRTDIGVPLWLNAALRARSQSIGMLEEGDSTTAFDSRVITPAQVRPDPCAGMRKP